MARAEVIGRRFAGCADAGHLTCSSAPRARGGAIVKPANSVLSGLGTTVFEVMSRLAIEHGAINLGQGFPDEDGPEDVRRAAAEAAVEGPNQYPPMMASMLASGIEASSSTDTNSSVAPSCNRMTFFAMGTSLRLSVLLGEADGKFH